MFTPAPVHGLLLAGGKSTRMGRDKAELKVDGATTLRTHGLNVLSDLHLKSFLSISSDDQRDYKVRTIRDRVAGLGPLGALDSAFAVQPHHAWLVIACDMPNLSAATLKLLLDHRNPSRDATCFVNPIDGMAEPLCTIYEPAAAEKISEAVRQKKLCARRLLASLSLNGVLVPAPDTLANCNRPEDLKEMELRRKKGSHKKTITVEFFASLREQAPKAAKEITTTSVTAAGLWDELRLKHGFKHDLDSVRLALNDEFAPWTTQLKDGDRAAFLPPFAGG